MLNIVSYKSGFVQLWSIQVRRGTIVKQKKKRKKKQDGEYKILAGREGRGGRNNDEKDTLTWRL